MSQYSLSFGTLQQSSSCSRVSFLTNPKGQPSCFLLLLYESSLASASIFIRQFDVCSHHSAGPASRGGRAEGADVTRMRAGPGRAALARRRRRPPELSPLPLPLPPALLLRPGLLLLRPGLLPLRPGLRCRLGALSPGSRGISPPHRASSTKTGGTWGRTAGRAVETWAALTPCSGAEGVVRPDERGAGARAGERGEGCSPRGPRGPRRVSTPGRKRSAGAKVGARWEDGMAWVPGQGRDIQDFPLKLFVSLHSTTTSRSRAHAPARTHLLESVSARALALAPASIHWHLSPHHTPACAHLTLRGPRLYLPLDPLAGAIFSLFCRFNLIQQKRSSGSPRACP
nr:uncharacterized protein LOC107129754 [Macaca fascicularis]